MTVNEYLTSVSALYCQPVTRWCETLRPAYCSNNVWMPRSWIDQSYERVCVFDGWIHSKRNPKAKAVTELKIFVYCEAQCNMTHCSFLTYALSIKQSGVTIMAITIGSGRNGTAKLRTAKWWAAPAWAMGKESSSASHVSGFNSGSGFSPSWQYNSLCSYIGIVVRSQSASCSLLDRVFCFSVLSFVYLSNAICCPQIPVTCKFLLVVM